MSPLPSGDLRGELLWDFNQNVMTLGHRDIGSNQSKVRFRASLACERVQVHIQKTGTGGANYNTVTFVVSNAVDCRENRQQEVTITRDGTNRFYVFLVPVVEIPAGSGGYVGFDGVQLEDRMVILDLGI